MGDVFDRFGDVIQRNSGIFKDGLDEFDTLATTPTPGGLVVEMACRGCGRPKQIVFDWQELIAVRHNAPPQYAFRDIPSLSHLATPWRTTTTEGDLQWMPETLRCDGCQQNLYPKFTPEECAIHLAKAARNGWLNPQAAAQLEQHCKQVAASMRGR